MGRMITVNTEKCTNCKMCELACSLAKTVSHLSHQLTHDFFFSTSLFSNISPKIFCSHL